MNLIEAWGSGIPKLMKAMKDYGLLEPEFVDMEIAFRINLYRSQDGLNTNQVSNQVAQKTNRNMNKPNQDTNQDANQANGELSQDEISLKKEEILLVRLIADEPKITQMEMAGQLGWSLGRVKHYITKLKKNHVLERVGSSQKGYWNVLVEDSAWRN